MSPMRQQSANCGARAALVTVVPGPAEGRSPEPITTIGPMWHDRTSIASIVAMDSWLAASRRPGMTHPAKLAAKLGYARAALRSEAADSPALDSTAA